MAILLGLYSLISRGVCRIKAVLFKTGIRRPRKAPLPVISVGNLTLGGSEKTPLARELLTHFLGLGRRPAFVTRGYLGRWEKGGGILSDGRTLRGGWEEAGDEPSMIARHVPGAGVFVGKNRTRSCLKAKEMGFDLAVLDDGFQHIKLARDVDIVLFDATAKGGRREGTSAMRRADIILVKKDGEAALPRIRQKFPAAAVFEYTVVFRGLRLLETGERTAADVLKEKTILAFCGIARPERFFSLLMERGLPPRTKMCFPDHYPYPPPGLERIAAACERDRIDALLTTEKDAVKLLGRPRPFASTPLYVLEIGLDLPPAFFEKIESSLGPADRVLDLNRPQAARPS
ncbi:MAG: tetraacyldisaccharide 4'-kinase [Candidatus Aminicenantes bacterium]|nr:tetraacyldisaccharide 4'-kinase [Candidatus Aminicenantes bacterium]